MVLALGGSAVGQQNAVILLTPAEITWGTRPDGGKISVIEGVCATLAPSDARDSAGGLVQSAALASGRGTSPGALGDATSARERRSTPGPWVSTYVNPADDPQQEIET